MSAGQPADALVCSACEEESDPNETVTFDFELGRWQVRHRRLTERLKRKGQMRYFERYQAGEYLPVWRDIKDIPWYSLQEKHAYTETLADVMQVVRETMARVKHNIDLLIPRLQSLGYEFGYGWVGLDDPENPWADSDRRWVEQAPPLLSPPLPDLNERFERIRQGVGYVPLSLQAFYEVVGGVNLVGTIPSRWMPCLESLPAVDYSMLDPLVVNPLDDDLIEASIEAKKLYISPDEYTKYNISGAEPYHITDPCMKG